MTLNDSNKSESTQKNDLSSKKINFLKISFYLIIAYLSLKLIILPVTQTVINIIPHLNSPENIKADSVKIPDLSFPDILLLTITFLFQPQASQIFESFDLTSDGIRAKFRELKKDVEKKKEEIDELQQEQLNKIENIQQFMFQLLLTKNEIDKLQGLRKHIDNDTPFDFKVYEPAAKELRRLRDSKLIRVKSPYEYIKDLEVASNYGDIKIDLTKYCELTSDGRKFLEQLDQFSQQKNKNL